MNLSTYTDADLIEFWHERAAVFEFDGELPRQDANYRAYAELRRMIAPRKVPQEIIDGSRRFSKKEPANG